MYSYMYIKHLYRELLFARGLASSSHPTDVVADDEADGGAATEAEAIREDVHTDARHTIRDDAAAGGISDTDQITGIRVLAAAAGSTSTLQPSRSPTECPSSPNISPHLPTSPSSLADRPATPTDRTTHPTGRSPPVARAAALGAGIRGCASGSWDECHSFWRRLMPAPHDAKEGTDLYMPSFMVCILALVYMLLFAAPMTKASTIPS